MNNIQIFQNQEFGTIRTISNKQGEAMFCLKDVCEVLELRTQKVVQRLEDDVLSKYPIVDNLGRVQQATFVNEDGLYDTILESRKPQAKQFRKWVTSEVLPSIRKQGGYMMARPNENDTEAYIRTVLTLSGIGGQEYLLPPEKVMSYHRLSKLLAAMTVMENGIRPHQVDTEAIYQGYKLTFPQNAQELDEWMLGEDEYGEW